MRTIWAVFAGLSFVAGAAIWMFAVGWAGGFPWLDKEQLATGEWPWWLVGFLVLYGPIAFGGWCLFRAYRETD